MLNPDFSVPPRQTSFFRSPALRTQSLDASNVRHFIEADDPAARFFLPPRIR
jgi:hypothetical protein